MFRKLFKRNKKEMSDTSSGDVVSTPGKVWQEFYCAESGGGCGGYVMVKLNMAISGVVKVICPNCKHEHGRVIENGHLKENFSSKLYTGKSRNDKTDQEIIPTMAAFSWTPRTTLYLQTKFNKNSSHVDERVCPIVQDPQRDIGSQFLRESWIAKHGIGNDRK